MWYKEKTTWAGIAAAISAIGGVLSGELTWPLAVPVILTAVIGIFCDEGKGEK